LAFLPQISFPQVFFPWFLTLSMSVWKQSIPNAQARYYKKELLSP
jgi:hypothetical protein